MDVGAEVEHYAADITRTRALSRLSRRQWTVYEAVLSVQSFALDMLKPGILLKEYEREIENYMGEKLRELGRSRRSSTTPCGNITRMPPRIS